MKYNIWWHFWCFFGLILAAVGMFGAMTCAIGFLGLGFAIILSSLGG